MLPKPLESGQRQHSQDQREHHVVRAVRSVQQIPRHFADDCEQHEGKEVPHPVPRMGETFRNQESEHGEGDTPEALERIKVRFAAFILSVDPTVKLPF